MDPAVCARCGKPQPETFVRFAVVAVEEDKSTHTEKQGVNKVETTTTTTTERLQGVESCSFCTGCLRKQRTLSMLIWGLGTFLLGLIVGFVITWLITDKALVSLIVGAVLGVVIGSLFASNERDLEIPFVAAKLYPRLPGVCGSYRYLPLHPELYTRKGETAPDPVVFKSKNNLKTDLADAICRRYLM